MFLLFIVLIFSIIKTQITRIVFIKSNTVIFTFTCLNFVSSDRLHIPWEKSLVFLFNPWPTFSVPVQFNSVAQSCPTLCAPWITMCQAFLPITNSQNSFKLMSIKSVMPIRWTCILLMHFKLDTSNQMISLGFINFGVSKNGTYFKTN